MKALLPLILFAIVVAAIAVAIGTPIAAILVYKHRSRLFPDMQERHRCRKRKENSFRKLRRTSPLKNATAFFLSY